MSDSLNLHQKNGKYVNVDGLNIFTIDKGEGEPIVLVHGLFSSSYSYRKIIDILSPNYRVIAPDFPGIGFSEQLNGVYSHRLLAEILFKFLEKITNDRIHLVAYDYGGPISFLMLNEHPEKVKSITVISSFLNLEKIFSYTPLFWLHKRFIGNLMSNFLNEKTLGYSLNHHLISKEHLLNQDCISDYAFLLLQGSNKKNLVKMSQCIDRTVYAKKDMESGIKKMIGGRQIIIGEHDRMIHYSEYEYIKQLMRLSITHFLPGKHMLIEECPVECAEKIEMLVKTFSRKVTKN